MKSREVVTKDNYKGITLKRMIIICWILLGICFLVKIFGGNFFNIVCNNEQFIKVCAYIENTFWYYVVSFIFNCLNTIIIWMCMLRQIKLSKKDLIVAITIILVTYLLQVLLLLFINSLIVSFLMTIVRYVIIPIFVFKLNWKVVIVICLLDVFTQFITIIIRNLSLVKIISDNVLITLIYMIDYYIMTILVCLYSYRTNKKENNMGLFGGWWLHKPLAELEALLPTLKDEKEIKACQKRIAKLKEKEGK